MSMAITPYLAMTAGERNAAQAFPTRAGWLSCHFSASGTGLSNLPVAMPSGSLLILDDSTPMDGHDPEQIAGQLEDCAKRLRCAGILLDFQQPGAEEIQNLVARLEKEISVPLIVSAAYAKNAGCAVFLPPVPADVPLSEYLSSWRGNLAGGGVGRSGNHPDGIGSRPQAPAPVGTAGGGGLPG